jgi:hypothetical protein
LKLPPPYLGPQQPGSSKQVRPAASEVLLEVRLDKPMVGLVVLQCPLAASPTWTLEMGAGLTVLTETFAAASAVERRSVAGEWVRVTCQVVTTERATAIFGVRGE